MQFNKKTLKNGLRIITVPMPDSPSITILITVETGSKYETKEINGLSHFLEHMVFKGTPKRPKAADISRELDSIGAVYNAFTSQEFTGYYAKSDKKHFHTVLDIVSDMYINPSFPEAEINKEKGVIIEEIRMYNDLPQRKVLEAFWELLFGDTPAGWSVLGTEENIRSFDREKLINYRNNHYVSSATTVVVAGDINEKIVLEKIEKAFADIKTGPKSPKMAVKESQNSPAVKVVFRETDQTHLVMGFRTFSLFDKRNHIMAVLSTILGGSMSSRLFSKMRDELGICYYVSSSHEPSTDHGVFSISAGLDNSRVEEGIKGILEECARLGKEEVGEAELRKAKDYIVGTTMLGLETSDERAEFCGFQETLKAKIEKLEEFEAKIRAVTAKEIKELAKETFANAKLNLAIIGKIKNPEDIRRYLQL